MPDYAINGSTLTGIADAIRSKTGKSEKITPEQMPAEIQSITGGGEPDPPDDGKTRLYITIPANAVEGLPPPRSKITVFVNSGSGCEIDFGDGSEVATANPGTGGAVHEYKNSGDYVISINGIDGSEFSIGYGQKTGCVIGSTNTSNSVYRCMLKKVITQSGAKLASYALYTCYALSRLILQTGTDSISSNACYSCYALSSVIIPENVKDIGDYAFAYCYGLKEVYLRPTTPPTITTTTFSSVPSDCVYYVPVGSLETYKAATNWAAIADQIQEEPA